MVGVGSLGPTYESAFWAVSKAYTGSAQNMAKCNVDTSAALKQIEDSEKIYGNSKD